MTNLKSLLGKLNDTSRRALESAAGLCLSRTNYEVDIEHLLLKLLDASNTDMQRIDEHFGVNASRLTRELTSAIDRFKTGNARTPAMSPRLPRLMSDAWLIASVDFGASSVRSGHLLLALLSNDELSGLVTQGAKELQLIVAATLREKFAAIVAGSDEDKGAASLIRRIDGNRRRPRRHQGARQVHDRSHGACKQGAIDPITGRDFEIRQLVDILMRRRQNNPILTEGASARRRLMRTALRMPSDVAAAAKRVHPHA